VLSRVAFEKAGGDTALIDTIYGSLHELRSGIHTRKALLVISDGMDNHSRYSKQELLDRAVESDAQIYTMAVDNAPAFAKPIERMEERRGLLFLDELAAKTGGMSFIVRDQTGIAAAAASIGRALRNQYTIGFVPRGDGHGGQWRRIKVKVEGSGLRAYARTGYRLE
jgi:Ca-activated chloride channel family protein